VYWKSGVRHNSGIARPKHRQAQMAKTLFRAYTGQHFRFRVKPNIPQTLVFFRHLGSQILDTFRRAVSVVARVLSRFAQLIDDDLRGPVAWVTHTQIDNIGALLALCQFQSVQPPKKIGRQTLYPLCRLNLKFRHNLSHKPGRFFFQYNRTIYTKQLNFQIILHIETIGIARKLRTFINITGKGRDAFGGHTKALRQIIGGL
jgi:hypothetical protein